MINKMNISLLMLVLTFSAMATGKSPGAVKEWYGKLPSMHEKLTELHFYLHDIVTNPNSTNIPIVKPNSAAQSPTYFGLLAVMDDLLTDGPDPHSEVVGRAQGLFGSTSIQELGYHMMFHIVFTNGKYNGSTLNVIGHNPFMSEFREVPVVGGSGVFRLARGTAVLHTMTYDNKTGNAVVEYSVFVLHY